MAKLTLSDLSSLENQTSAISTLNANNALIEAALENTLSRDGTSPNAMEADLDMNNNRILNLPEAVADQEPVRRMDVQGFVDDAEQAATDAEAALASFTDIWLGNSSANPTLDLDGSALDGGEIYYNTVAARLRVYKVGTGWVDVAPFEDLAQIAAYVLAAAASAAAALTSENNAADSAADALADRIAAGVSAIAAAGSATQAEIFKDAAVAAAAAAAASALEAAGYKDDAQDAKTAAELALDSFTDLYLGEKNNTPLLDNDGDALRPGTLYYDTGSSGLKFYNGTIWVTLNQVGLTQVEDDVDPHLGNDLVLNGFDITGTGNIDIDGDIEITGFIHAAGGIIDFDDDVNIDGTLNVEGATTIDDVFNVTGAADFDSSVNIDGTLQVALGALFSSTVGITGQLDGTTAIFSGVVDASDVTVDDEAYGVLWNGSVEVPTKNAVYDKIESILDGQTFTGAVVVPDDAYAVGWNGSAEVPTKNAVYDKIELILGTTLPATYQPLDSDLTSWAGVTRASGFDTFVTTPSLANLGSLLTDDASGAMTFLTTPSIANLMSLLTDDASGLGTFLVTPSSANLRSLITDETGTGLLYFQGGDAGTPSALVLTNATGLPLSSVIDSTSEALGVGTLEVGDASDTTIARAAAGKISVEGSNVLMESGNAHKKTITFIVDGGGLAISTGIKADVRIPWACTITKNSILADVSGAIVFDIWKDTYANYPPVVGDSITASAKPTISASGVKSEDATLTGWTTSIAAGDTLRLNVDSCTSITRATLTLEVTLTQ